VRTRRPPRSTHRRRPSRRAGRQSRRHTRQLRGPMATLRTGPAPSNRPMAEPGAPEGEGLAEGTLISHLLELRDRLLKAMLAVGICFIPCAYYMNQIFSFVAKPLIQKLPAGATLIATSVVAPFTVPFKMALLLA